MCRHAGKHLDDFNVAIAGRVGEIGQVGLIGHEHVRVVPTDDFAKKTVAPDQQLRQAGSARRVRSAFGFEPCAVTVWLLSG